MDNKLFKVNGRGQEFLTQCLNLIGNQGGRETTVKAWKTDDKLGFILYWTIASHTKEINPFPTPLTMEEVAPIVWKWLESEEGKAFECVADWEGDCDHDGHNGKGFTVYVEDWGHVGSDWSPLCAVRPSFLWFGK